MRKLQWIALIILIGLSFTAHATVIKAKDYGVIGDGVQDDGPAIKRAVSALLKIPGSKTLLFDTGKSFYIKNSNEIYLFKLHQLRNLTVDGGGSTFLLDARVRFMELAGCRNVTVKNLAIDYHKLPFADGIVLAKNETERWIDVQVAPGFEMPSLGGPTYAKEEQAYFAELWNQGPNSLLGTAWWLKDVREAYPGSTADRVLRLEAELSFQSWSAVTVQQTRVSIPERGIAHMGPDEVIRIIENENVYFNKVSVWSAPWFSIGVTRNKGEVIFKHTHIEPKPGSGRLTASWRDGFHVTSNYAKLLWEDCRLEGMNDDAFNIKTFTSTLTESKSPGEFVIRQNYPLTITPYQVGDWVTVYDVREGRILGRSKVTSSTGFTQTGRQPAPDITLQLESPIAGITPGCQVWNETSANTNTTLRRCTILNSCRIQSSVTIDDCDVKALLWFYGDNLEGRIPSNITVKNSRLMRGRGNPTLAIVFSTDMSINGKHIPSRDQVMDNIRFINNSIDGDLRMEHAKAVLFDGNRFASGQSLLFGNSRELRLRGNTIGQVTLSDLSQIQFMDDATRQSTEIK